MHLRGTLMSSIALAAVGLSACAGEDPPPSPGDTAGDALAGDPNSSGDANGGDPLAGDTDVEDELPVRFPASHIMTCTGASEPSILWDTDHVCDVPALGVELSIQATPTSCVTMLAERAYYDGGVRAWAKQNGVVTEIAAAYDDGHHGNDVIHFELDGRAYFIWHSSFGFGWRACAPPDCLMTCDEGASFETCAPSGTWHVDGCARDSGDPPPPSPVTCVGVGSSGVPELLDPWDGAPGAPYPLLPCPGDI